MSPQLQAQGGPPAAGRWAVGRRVGRGASSGCRNNRHESLLVGSHANLRGLHSWVKFPRPSVKFSLWATSLQSLQNVQATKCLNHIRIAWAEKPIRLHQIE